jgi:CubicO group peptidase (beta-lactamase class C family)
MMPTIYRVSSMTKPVVAVATMILVDEGKLRLDEPIDRLLPELANRNVLRHPDAPIDDVVSATRAITVRDLLAFTCGLGISFSPRPIQKAMDDLALAQGMPSPQTAPPPDEWIRRLGTLPLIHQPGERWMYNTGASIAGVLVARASGQSLDAFMEERIFAPLGMNDTAFYVPKSKLSRFLPGRHADGTIYDEVDGQWSKPPAFPNGADGLVSTENDFRAFGRMLLEGGGKILSRESVHEMTRDQLTPAQKKATTDWLPGWFDDHGWGLGMMVVTGRDDSGAPGAFGWDGGLGTSFRVDPQENDVRVFCTDTAWSSPEPPRTFRDFWRVSRTR